MAGFRVSFTFYHSTKFNKRLNLDRFFDTNSTTEKDYEISDSRDLSLGNVYYYCFNTVEEIHGPQAA
jgi:hypothetical protein